MKKLLIASLAVFALAACGDKESAKEDGNKLGVEKNLTNVELTLPAALFEDETKEDIERAAKEKGIKEVRVNEDGSVYYKMSRSTHKEMLAEMKKSVNETMDDLVTDENFVSFKKVDANKNFTSFDITVDQNAYDNSFDAFGLMGLGLVASYYDIFNGTDNEDVNIEMNLIDEATGDNINTINFPEDLDDEEESNS